MASYQVRQRDPLIDEGTQAMLERRGRELIGLGLIAVAALVFLMLATYSPTDLGWLEALFDPGTIAGARYPEAGMTGIESD